MGYARNGAHQGVKPHHVVFGQLAHNHHGPFVTNPVDDL
jgi:hypothetical protein